MNTPIVSGLPGVFYRCPGPGKDEFVTEGQHVEAGQTIGLIEIMKMFNEIRTEVSGVLTEFCIEDEGMVNPGDTIAIVTTD